MSKKSLLAAALLLGLGTAAMAAPAQTITVVSGSGHVLVNGKEYVPGTAIANGDKVTIAGGEVTVKIGDTTISSQGGEFQYDIGAVQCLQGSITVTPRGMRPMTIAAPAGGMAGAAAGAVVFLPPPPPPVPPVPPVPT
ncbi:MAG: hypothetical protein KGK30_09755, partial [Elusimicrobia bacterium]|nr:hypothetical protein [Elusimicrobiota bacterium]